MTRRNLLVAAVAAVIGWLWPRKTLQVVSISPPLITNLDARHGTCELTWPIEGSWMKVNDGEREHWLCYSHGRWTQTPMDDAGGYLIPPELYGAITEC